MVDHVLDTNVFLVASASHYESPFDDSDLPVDLQERVLDWLEGFNRNDSVRMVLDEGFSIYNEYMNKLSGQDFGMLVIRNKMPNARFVEIDYDENGNGIVPEPFADFDPSDRKFLAALLTDVDNISLVNACDTDWLEIEDQLTQANACIIHLLEDWLRDKFNTKKGK